MSTAKKKPKGRGGARKGAGRTASEDSKRMVSMRLSPAAIERLDALAAEQGEPKAGIVERLILDSIMPYQRAWMERDATDVHLGGRRRG